MTRSRLPAITLTCRNGHEFTTEARGGSTVRCKTCGAPKAVPANRPKTAKEAAALAVREDHQDQDHAPGRELAERWGAEGPWSGILQDRAGDPQDACPECGELLSWEARGTLAYCDSCKCVDLAPSIAEHYDRQSSNSTEVAIRERADPIDEIAAQSRLRGLIIEAGESVKAWVRNYGNPDSYDRIQWKREADAFGAAMRGWLPAIEGAKTEDRLTQIKGRILADVIDSEPGRALRAEREAVRNRAEQAELRRQRAEEMEQAQAEAEAARQRQQVITAHVEKDVRQIATREPRAITAGPAASVMQADPFTGLAKQVWDAQERKSRAIAERGECAFRHPLGAFPADGVCGIPHRDYLGTETGYVAESPQLRACEKHAPAALAHLRRQGYNDLKWWPHAS